MNLLKFIIKSLSFYKRQHFAVFLGTIISTAVLTGSLIIGDSVKLSLRKFVDTRLGKIEYALFTGDRFVRTDLAYSIAKELNIKTTPIILVNGIAINSDNNSRINNVQILGIDSSFWNLSNIVMQEIDDDEAIISKNTAEKLKLKIGDEILIRVRNAELIPLNAPFVSEGEPSVSIRVKIKKIANSNELGRFNLKSNQVAPYNIFLSYSLISKKLELADLANIILTNSNTQIKKEQLNKALKKVWKLKDMGLKIGKLEQTDKFELLSERIFIENTIKKSISSINHKTILTYLVNSIKFNNKETPYSFISANNLPIIPKNMTSNEIVINNWLADDLNVTVGDSIDINYFIIDPLRMLKERTKVFVVKKIIATQDSSINSSLMPKFPGITDAGNCKEWETGIPIDLDKIRDKDEDYWNKYKGTPKAFITIGAGNELWQNKFGSSTSLHFSTNDISIDDLEKQIIEKLNPKDINLNFVELRNIGINAANNSVDFGELFISLSFFVLVAAILLTVLIHSLNTEARLNENGILLSLGFTKKQIIKLRFRESLIVIVFAGIVGSLVGILYNYIIMAGLNTVWQDVVRTKMLEIFIVPKTLFIGTLSGVLIAMFAIYLVTRKKLKQSITNIINKNSADTHLYKKRNTVFSKLFMIFSIVVSIFFVSYLFVSSSQNAEMFLSAGALVMIATISISNHFLLYTNNRNTTKVLNIWQFAIKNAARNKARSISIIIMLTIGVFTILITGANRKTYYNSENINNSGTGGYEFWAETSLAILYNLNTNIGKEKLGLDNEELVNKTKFIQFHRLEGDDASCLNLNQVNNPQILGVNPKEFYSRKSFSFAKLIEGANKDKAWLELNKKYGKNIIPAFADQTVITWGIKKSIGDTLKYINENGEEINLLLIGGFNNSIFQGNIIIADSIFTKHFPSVSGSQIMLIDTDENQKELAELLESLLVDYGIVLQKTSDRLAQFNSVENTYLTVFMILGGLGVIIGTFGLGIVLLRNMIERKQEIALFIALGFTKNNVFKLIFLENLLLLIIGYVCGLIAAFIGILPSLLSEAFKIPGTFVFILTLIVLINGILWIFFPTKFAVKNNLISALRNE